MLRADQTWSCGQTQKQKRSKQRYGASTPLYLKRYSVICLIEEEDIRISDKSAFFRAKLAWTGAESEIVDGLAVLDVYLGSLLPFAAPLKGADT